MTMDWDEFEQMRETVRNWGRWGADDELGTLNFATAEAVAAAAKASRTGRAFSLSMSIDSDGPQSASGFRRNPVHLMTVDGGDDLTRLEAHAGTTQTADAVIRGHRNPRFGFADDFLIMPLQAASHWDALSHVFFDGYLYNQVPASSVTSLGASRLSIAAVAQGGVCARGVLLDLARHRGASYLPPDTAVLPEELDEVVAAQGVEIRPGDVLVFNTGTQIRYRETRAGLFDHLSGLDWRCAEWLHSREVAAVASDNAGIESGMKEGLLPLHVLCQREMGMIFGEMWELEELSADCARDGQYDFQLVAPPLNVTGAVGAPVNPIAIK